MTLADRVVAVLTGHGIPHALIGAAALAAAGIARSTFDLDLLTTDARVLQADLWQDLRDAGAAVDVRPGDHSDPLLGVVRLEMPDQRPVDLIVGRHQWQRIAIERARREPGGIAVVIPRDLVLLNSMPAAARISGTFVSCCGCLAPPRWPPRSRPTWTDCLARRATPGSG
jgi:hypothetical protein